MDKQYLNDEFNRFFEFTTEDKSQVSSVSAKLFAEHIAYPLERELETLRQRVAELEAAVKKSNDRLNEERDIWDRMFGDGEKKLERIEIELDDCLHVLEALWMKQNTPELTDLWAKILIRNKRATGASSAEDTCHPTTE